VNIVRIRNKNVYSKKFFLSEIVWLYPNHIGPFRC
jgi:hypothetical protein